MRLQTADSKARGASRRSCPPHFVASFCHPRRDNVPKPRCFFCVKPLQDHREELPPLGRQPSPQICSTAQHPSTGKRYPRQSPHEKKLKSSPSHLPVSVAVPQKQLAPETARHQRGTNVLLP
jgi:hypothetical protein